MKNYVSKLNDRNLQRKRESGMTSYVLYSIVIIVLYKIFEFYPLIPFRKSFWEILPLLVCTFNFILGFVIIRMVYMQTSNHVSNLRIFLNSNSIHLLDEVLLYSLLLIPSVSTIVVSIRNYHNNIENGYFITMSIILLIFLILIFGLLNSEKNSKNSYLEIFDGTGERTNDRDKWSIIVYLISLFFIIFSAYTLFNFQTNIAKINVFLFGVFFYALPCILLEILELRESDNFTQSLENLEYEINVRGLSDEEIKIRLQQNYYGFYISDWINYNSQLFEDIKLDFEKKQANIQLEEVKLSKIDKELFPDEYRIKSKDISTSKVQSIRELNSFCFKKLQEMSTILNNDQLNGAEKTEIYNFYKNIKSHISV
ncbi:hypothetical protein [Flavobacterium sp.]|uniref:hypothetical protein n=1 Tax=Flavobacterium sp. TaxID=239 RepID=UPI00391CEF22